MKTYKSIFYIYATCSILLLSGCNLQKTSGSDAVTNAATSVGSTEGIDANTPADSSNPKREITPGTPEGSTAEKVSFVAGWPWGLTKDQVFGTGGKVPVDCRTLGTAGLAELNKRLNSAAVDALAQKNLDDNVVDLMAFIFPDHCECPAIQKSLNLYGKVENERGTSFGKVVCYKQNGVETSGFYITVNCSADKK